jgi:endonuclease YncB( thermonuclease family)/dipeptidyl aminopeptidase/acylaminoacyl peptidase
LNQVSIADSITQQQGITVTENCDPDDFQEKQTPPAWIRPEDLTHPKVFRSKEVRQQAQRRDASMMSRDTRTELSGRIVFSRYWGNYGVFSMNTRGEQLTRLSPTKIFESHPVFSKDGRKIAFSSMGALWTMNADGTERKEIVSRRPGDRTGMPHIAWHPDGDKLMFELNRNLYIVGASGGEPTLFQEGATGGSWNPDGSKIAFSAKLSNSNTEIFVIDAEAKDASEARRLTFDPENQPVRDSLPSWSRDGKRIVFESAGNLNWVPGGIWVMDSDGEDLRLIPGTDFLDKRPCFTGDGKHIVYAHQPNEFHSICIVDSTHKSPIHYTLTSGEHSIQPHWGPEVTFASIEAAPSPIKTHLPTTEITPQKNISGICVKVIDGDTVEVLSEGSRVKMQFYGVSTPKGDAPFSTQARHFTTNTALGRKVTVYPKSVDAAGMITGWFFVDGKSMSTQMIQQGFARWNRAQAPKEVKLEQLEKEAKAKHLGLWSQHTP